MPRRRWTASMSGLDAAELCAGRENGWDAGRQDCRRQSVPDELSGDRIVGDFVGADRLDAGGGEALVEALPYSPSGRKVDEVVAGQVGQLDPAAVGQRVTGFADEHHGLAHQLAQG